jgi:hypothetical protein
MLDHCVCCCCCCCCIGSSEITTIDPRPASSHIDHHRLLSPLEWVHGLQTGQLTAVDYAFAFSSWEHEGLGRYGGAMDPWGDVKAVQRASCYVRPGGWWCPPKEGGAERRSLAGCEGAMASVKPCATLTCNALHHHQDVVRRCCSSCGCRPPAPPPGICLSSRLSPCLFMP